MSQPILDGFSQGGTFTDALSLTVSAFVPITATMAVVFVATNFTGLPTSVTLGAISGTLLANNSSGALSIWELPNPPQGSTVAMTVTVGSTGSISAVVGYWHNVDPATPFGATANTSVTSAPSISLPVSGVTADQIVLSALAAKQFPISQNIDIASSTGSGNLVQLSYAPGPGNLTVGYNFSGNQGGFLTSLIMNGVASGSGSVTSSGPPDNVTLSEFKIIPPYAVRPL